MREKVLRLLFTVALAFMVFILPANYVLKISVAYKGVEDYSKAIFWQIDQLIERSAVDVKRAKSDFAQECVKYARAAAYIAEYRPEVVQNIEETKKVAALLGVAEIHFFDTQGVLYAGTHPEHYGFTFQSGEQMEYFLPMLQDRSLALCQDMTPNTAKGELMQYAAVWREDGKGIVQIGVKPERVFKVIQDKTLTATMAVMPESVRGEILVIKPENGVVLAASNAQYIGKPVEKILPLSMAKNESITVSRISYAGERLCVALQKSEKYIYATTYNFHYILQDIFVDTAFLLIYLVLFSLLTIVLVMRYMDKKLVRGLESIVSELNKIEEGNLEYIEMKTGVPEFEKLLYYINKMLQSVLGSFQKFATVIEKSKIPIGIYEYNAFYKRAFANKNVADILRLEWKDNQKENLECIAKRIAEIQTHRYSLEEDVYCLEQDGQTYYIRMEEFYYGQSKMFWMMDVSHWWDQMEVLKSQRDTDVLTNLYNRRAFYEKVEAVFTQDPNLAHTALVMIDADKLKDINDVYGHEQGDRYLQAIARLFLEMEKTHTICARLGGDEFALLLHGYATQAQLQDALTCLEEKRDQIGMQICENLEVKLRYSIGYAMYPQDGQTCEMLMHCADERMYQDKKHRKEADSEK